MNFKSFYIFTIFSLIHQIRAQSCQDGNLRLTGGPNIFEGRVEECVDGSWGQVCAMGWGSSDARVVCRQLGHSTDRSETVRENIYGGEPTPARLFSIACVGDENQLVECQRQSLDGSTSCAELDGPAGVVCGDPMCSSDSTSVRLSKERVVEVCASGLRTGVCSSDWDDTDASVVCRQLSLGNSGVAESTGSVFYRTRGAYDSVNCTISDQTLSQCERGPSVPQCNPRQFAQVECEGTVTTPTAIMATTTLTSTTTPDTPAETTAIELANTQTTAGFEGTDSTSDVEQTSTSETTSDSFEVTMGVGSPQSQSNSQLLAIVLGAVGGLIVVLLFGIIVLLIVVVLSRQKRKYAVQYLDNSINGHTVMATLQDTAKEDQLANYSYISQKGDTDRNLLNPLHFQNHHQMVNSNPLPYASVVTPPSTADDTQLHDYATLDDFQPTVSQWPPKQPQEYSDPVRVLDSGGKNRTSGLPNVYNEPMLPGDNREVGEDGIVTDRQGYAMLDPTARSYYECPIANGAPRSCTEGISSLPVPQPYEAPFQNSFESLYEDASSTNVSRSTTPVNTRKESPERKDSNLATNHTLPEKEAHSTHDYATLESPK